MKRSSRRGYAAAVGTAVLMHLLLFVLLRPSAVNGRMLAAPPPETRYAMPAGDGGTDMLLLRMMKSPALFSLPSALGFSRELRHHDVQNRKTITPLHIRSEHFQELTRKVADYEERLNPEELMLSAAVRGPALPSGRRARGDAQQSVKRVQLAPDLAGRLLGGVVLPPDLNQPAGTPWVVRASVTVSEQGAVEHVLLDQPLESPALNRQVLQVLYRLRFKPGKAADSSIEIYSPEPAVVRGEIK